MLTGTQTAAEARADWSTAFVNTLPDSAFAVISPGGTKDSSGKTTPRSLRHFPHHDAQGAVDMPHLRNGMARVPQADLPQTLKDAALRHLRAHGEAMGMDLQAMPAMNSAPPAAARDWRSAADGVPMRECRAFASSGLELRAGRGGTDLPTISGYAAVFDTPAFIGGLGGGFTEVVKPGAFAKAIRAQDVRALFNHDENLVLGRLDAGTLRLEEDSHGLRMEIDPPNTTTGRDVVEMVKRGDVSGASFGFTPVRQNWTQGTPPEPDRRELLEVRLFDVSPVVFPAYPETEVATRAIAWARRALGGDALTLSEPELRTIQRLLPAWERQLTTPDPETTPGEVSTGAQGSPEPGAIFDEYRRRLEAIEAELRGERT